MEQFLDLLDWIALAIGGFALAIMVSSALLPGLARHFGPWSLEPGESILDFLKAQSNCKDLGSLDLPDSEFFFQGTRFAPGTLDGILIRDGLVQDQAAAEELYRLLCSWKARLHPFFKYRLYQKLLMLEPLQLQDALDSLLSSNPRLTSSKPYAKLCKFLLYQGQDRTVIKFGLILYRHHPDFQRDYPEFRILARHDEFSYYIARSVLMTFKQPSKEVLKIAREVSAWGRIQTIKLLDRVKDRETQAWLAREGYQNDVVYEITIADCLKNCALSDQLDQMERDEVDQNLIQGALEMLSCLVQSHPQPKLIYPGFNHALKSLQPFLKDCNRVAQFNAMRSLSAYMQNQMLVITPFLDWGLPFDELMDFLSELDESCSRKQYWTEKVDRDLFSPEPQIFHRAVLAAQFLELDIWPLFLERLKEEIYSPSLWYEVFSSRENRRIKKALEFAQSRLPLDEIASGAALESGFSKQWLAHNCLNIILPHLGNFPGEFKPLIKSALHSPVVSNRMQALNVLSQWRETTWNSEFEFLLKTAVGKEPDPSIQVRMNNLLGDRPLEFGIEEESVGFEELIADETGIKYWA